MGWFKRLIGQEQSQSQSATPAGRRPPTGPPAGTGEIVGPSWMSTEDWASRLAAYRRQGRQDSEIRHIVVHLEQRGPAQSREKARGRTVTPGPGGGVSGGGKDGMVVRSDYVPKDDEARYLTRNADGLPDLRLVDAGDRLAIWSPVEGGALINPKGAGLRRLGLYASYARGGDYHQSAYRAADLRKGRWVELVREPDNPHDKNAVAMCAPGSRSVFAYVQAGRAPAVARRMDAGEDLAGVTMRGPARGRDDDSAFVLIGSRADLAAMLGA